MCHILQNLFSRGNPQYAMVELKKRGQPSREESKINSRVEICLLLWGTPVPPTGKSLRLGRLSLQHHD